MLINIAIDGPSASGKSTIAKQLAKRLSYKYLDTGAMYRCCAYKAKIMGIDINDVDSLNDMMQSININFTNEGNVILDNEDVSNKIRTNEISMLTSAIAKHTVVREKLVELQKEIAKDKGYILDGRDIGTIVLPNAEVKIFMIASVEARAKRRYKEAQLKHEDITYDTIYKDIEIRDKEDSERLISPLKKADDAVLVDSSTLTIEETTNEILDVIKRKTNIQL